MRELKDLLVEYEQNLCDKLFVLVLSNKKEINFRFFREDLCHLMGIQHVYGKSKAYLGKTGYERSKTRKLNSKV